MFPEKQLKFRMNNMRAVTLTCCPDKGELSSNLRIETVVKPEPLKKEVLIKVLFASISIDDINIWEGTELGGIPLAPSPSLKKPVTPGLELSGVVVKVGSNVANLKIGDSVFGISGVPFKRIGAWGEYCSVKEDMLLQKPDYLSYLEAVACGGSGMVSASIMQSCNLKKHHRVLIIGASGGVGTFVVQMAKQTGAYVISVCSKKNIPLVESLGSDEIIDYTNTSFVDVLAESKVDFVIDLVGGKEIEHNAIKVLKKNGEFKTIVGSVRYMGDHHLGWFGIVKMLSYISWRMFFSLFRKPKYTFVAGTRKTFSFFKEYLQTNTIKPVIDKKVNFNEKDIREAIDYVRTHRASGKVVIEVNKT